jgi:uncharacterized protein YidB (DUF937 family)
VQWYPVTLDEHELDTILRALNELNVYLVDATQKAALGRLVPRLQEAQDRGAIRAWLDNLMTITPDDFDDT